MKSAPSPRNDTQQLDSLPPVKEKLYTGLRWTAFSQAFQQILNLFWSVCMARLLEPQHFGLLAMASVFTGIIFFVLDLGLAAAVVQRKDLKEQHLSSIFWLNVFLGLALTYFGILISGWIAQVYNESQVQPVVIALSFNFLISSLSRTQSSILTRRMDFRSLELRNLVGAGVGTLASIGMAAAGLGVWSLVGRILITGLAGMLLLWSVSGWKPRWYFSWKYAQELLGFSTDVLVGNLMGYVSRNADNFLIGRFVGKIPLGYYAMAYNIMMFPVQRFSQVLASILFPAMSRLQGTPEKLTSAWLRASRLVSAVVMPLMMGLIALAPEFVETVYSAKWLPVVPILRILAIAGITQSLAWLNSSLMMAIAQTRMRLKLIALAMVVALTAFVIGLPYGIIGVASCFMLANLGTELFSVWKILQCIKLPLGQYLMNLAGVFTASFCMSIWTFIVVSLLPFHASTRLIVGMLWGGCTYIGLLQLFEPAVMVELITMMPKPLKRRFS